MSGYQPIPLLRTKLYRPPVAPDIVCRNALLERLDAGLDLPLTLVSAPAGYGESTLISHWLEGCGHASAWLSLDESDSDLRVFLSYLVAAIQTISPEACADSEAWTKAQSLPAVSTLARDFINDLDGIKETFILLLDEYHCINNADVHELVDQLLKHPPRTLHLVILARRDPPLSVATLRARRG